MKVDITRMVRIPGTPAHFVHADTLQVVSFVQSVPRIMAKNGASDSFVISCNGKQVSFSKKKLAVIVNNAGFKQSQNEEPKDDVIRVPLALDPQYVIEKDGKNISLFSNKKGKYLTPTADGAFFISVGGRSVRFTEKQLRARITNYMYLTKKAA
jgi:hypothetical protein